MPKKKVTIEVLMEGPGGDLVFKPVEFDTKAKLKQLAKQEKNPVLKHNFEKAVKEKGR